MARMLLTFAILAILPATSFAQKKVPTILEPGQTFKELQAFIEARLPPLPKATSKEEWDKEAQRLRDDMFRKVIYRGEAAKWRDAKGRVEWQETLAGAGYRLKKLRFEALPGLWIPALLYEPEKLDGKVPAALCVMGHERGGKDVEYQQKRCINLVRRGMLVLNLEWFMFGQLASPGNHHGALNQIDLCGASGLAPFYLAQKRGLDILLDHPNADAKRVAVSGLSGGGWQTIYISSMDTRVTLANPVAGYSSFRTRVRHLQDLGDSEQTPCDMATVADYDHLTALMAPRATLLTYNVKDDCCFVAGYALPPLLEGAGDFFQLYGRRSALRGHVNNVPGTHNYDKDNREAFYRMIGEHFYPGEKSFHVDEIPCDDEVRKKQELSVALPDKNATFNSLAIDLAKALPRQPAFPADKAAAAAWTEKNRKALATVVRYKAYDAKVEPVRKETVGKVEVRSSRVRLGDDWTIAMVDAGPTDAKGTTIRLKDSGRASVTDATDRRVVAIDPLGFGESNTGSREYLWSLMVSTVGSRPLGVQAGQVASLARLLHKQGGGPVQLSADGPRSSVLALVAAALEPDAIQSVEVRQSLGSLKEILEQNRVFNDMPEIFCFGLLEEFDVKHLAALVAPRAVSFVEPSERVRSEMSELRGWYRTLGAEVDPLK